jgi:TRIAD3 protein (E3 ubiquitin-protein ligase RNF216)
MTCPNCQTVSCYICREVITGYEHFGRINVSPALQHPPHSHPTIQSTARNPLQRPSRQEQMPAMGSSRTAARDRGNHTHPVHDQTKSVNTLFMQVQEAAKKAIEELKRDRPDVDESAIKIDLPVAGPARPVPNVGIRPQLLNMRPPLPHLHPPLPVNAAWGLPALPALPNARGPVPGAHAPAPNAYAVPAYGMTKSSPESAVVERPSLAHLEKKASMDMPDLGYQMPVPSVRYVVSPSCLFSDGVLCRILFFQTQFTARPTPRCASNPRQLTTSCGRDTPTLSCQRTHPPH